ncbi:MAG TPA: hypothetical protein VHT73_01200 [Thermodesulfobacteriota bacterium]|nr:hypothetical protein [Thermodesulfobacteriota bacterium]
MDEFMTSFVLLSKEKGVKCQLTSPNGAMIKGDKDALLEILDKADFASFGIAANKISVTMEFEEKIKVKNIFPAEIDVPDREKPNPIKGYL